MQPIVNAFGDIMTTEIVGLTFCGLVLGYIVGAIPGLGKVIATAVMIPISYYLSPVAAISFLIGISKGATVGNALSAILINTPGEASSAATALDGHPLARQGRATAALKTALFASVCGDFLATLILIMLAAPLASVALKITPADLTMIVLFSLTFIAALSGKSLARGLLSGFLGILLATVGIEPETGGTRMTFGLLSLHDGVPLVPLTIGVIAISEMLVQMSRTRESIPTPNRVDGSGAIQRREWRLIGTATARGTLIGSFIGILPGIGASIASFMSYGVTKRFSKHPEKFGDGAIEGIAASESADNAVIPSSLVPLFALGIPGSVVAAILMGAFMIHGVAPGPLVFYQSADIIYGIYAAMLLATPMLVVVGLCGMRLFTPVLRIPPVILIACVLFFCTFGAALEGGAFGIRVALLFSLLGVVMKLFDYSFVSFLIGFVLGPAFELSLRQAIALTPNDLSPLDYPVASLFLVATLIVVGASIVSAVRDRQPAASTLMEKSTNQLGG